MVRSGKEGSAACQSVVFNFSCFVWICKGDLNKRHNGKSNPMQSYLFCIKASKGGKIKERVAIFFFCFPFFSKSIELDLFREVLFILL